MHVQLLNFLIKHVYFLTMFFYLIYQVMLFSNSIFIQLQLFYKHSNEQNRCFGPLLPFGPLKACRSNYRHLHISNFGEKVQKIGHI
jgi:hypothetical protein